MIANVTTHIIRLERELDIPVSLLPLIDDDELQDYYQWLIDEKYSQTHNLCVESCPGDY